MPEAQATIVFPEHFGFCEGVEAADRLLKRVADEAHTQGIDTVYGLHKIVHNADVVREHEANGVIFVDEPEEIPPNQLVVSSAHGTAPRVQSALEANGATTFDAACLLVLHTHKAARIARRCGERLLYVCHGKPGQGKRLHDEIQAMVGHLDDQLLPGGVVYNPVDRHYLELGEIITDEIIAERGLYRIVTQTTLPAREALAYREVVERFILGEQPDAQVNFIPRGDVCPAVSNRQEGVERSVEIRPRPKRFVVVTDPTSANGQSYVDLATRLTSDMDTSVHAVSNAEEAAQLGVVEGVTVLTASASTPDRTTLAVADALGASNLPNLHRRAFHLDDLAGQRVQDKIQAHVERIRAA